MPAIAEVLGYVKTAPYLWQKPAKGREVGDLPSAIVMRALLTHAAANQIPLTADHLIWGATEAEVAAILAQRDAPAPAFTSIREVAA